MVIGFFVVIFQFLYDVVEPFELLEQVTLVLKKLYHNYHWLVVEILYCGLVITRQKSGWYINIQHLLSS